MSPLRKLLRLRRPAPPREQVSTRQRLDQARAAAEKWKAKAEELSARVQELGARLDAAQQDRQQAKIRGGAIHREVLSASVVRQTFAHRLRTLTARARSNILGREEQLLRVSASYRAEVEQRSAAAEGQVLRTTLDGLTWWIPVEKQGRRVSQAWVEKRRLPYHGILQTREVAPGGIMLDLGANVGRMAIPRVVLGDVMLAYCAEPDPVTYACLARNVVDNGLRGLVLPDQTAIGDRDGTVQLLRAGSSGNFRVVADESGDDDRVVTVPCWTLDTWVERLQIDLDAVTFIKVDVEGFERRLVAGASRVLACSHIAWQMEIKPAGLRAAGDEPSALYADLQRSFTHFTDLNRRASGKRVRPTAELPDALAYIEPAGKTDILMFSAG